jgi:3-hydroxyisobutyrate dehydrogenase
MADNLVVGMVGIGDLGATVAASILRKHAHIAFDPRPGAVEELAALGVRGTDSLEVLADRCDVVILAVWNEQQLSHIVGELLGHPGRLHTIIVSSMVLPGTVISLSEQAVKVGLDLIDAPVSGGAEQAAHGNMTVLIGGGQTAVHRCRPILGAFGGRLFHIGPVGAGSVATLVNNLLSVGGNMLILEAMQLADAYGISEDAVTEFVRATAGDSWGLRTWGRQDQARRSHRLAGTSAVYEIFSRDVKAAALAAGQRGVVLPIAASIGAMMGEKMQARDQFLGARGPSGRV